MATRKVTVIESVNDNVQRLVEKTVDDALILTDTVTGTAYQITIANGVLTPVEVVA